MRKSLVVLAAALVLTGAATGAAAGQAGSGWRIMDRHALGGEGGWDYLAIDQATQHLYVSRSDRVIVLDATRMPSMAKSSVIGEIDGLSGVHGIALADDLRKGFISNGRANTVTVFDPATLQVEQTIDVGAEDPDAILYDPYSKRVFTFNGDSNDASVIDAKSGKLLGHVALPGRPEFAVSDGQGHVFDNIESRNELAEIDPVAMKVIATWPLKGCDSPSGLAIDVAHHRLFSVCQNKAMAVTDSADGKTIASVPIDEGPDAARYDARRGLVFSSNGRSGTLTVVHQDDPDHYTVLQNVPTQKSARTMALDEASGRIYLSAAELGPRPTPTKAHLHPRPTMKPGSFSILVVGDAVGK